MRLCEYEQGIVISPLQRARLKIGSQRSRKLDVSNAIIVLPSIDVSSAVVVTGIDSNDTGDDDAGKKSSVSQADRQTILSAFRMVDDRHQEEQEIVNAIAERDQTGGIEHSQGSKKRHLTHPARLLLGNKSGLKRASDLVEAFAEDCVAGLSVLPQELRGWLRSVRVSEREPQPIGSRYNKDNQKRYASYAKQSVCYPLRVLSAVDALGVVDSQGESEDEQVNVDAMDTTRGVQDETPTGKPLDTMTDARRIFKWKEG